MSFDEFISKYSGRFVNYDGKYGYQCVDLIRQYCKEVIGVEGYTAIPQTGAAKSIFNNFPNAGNKYFTKILNSPTNAPQKGDIVFWGTYLFVTGWAGHTGVCSESNVMNFISFDQNYPTGQPCKFVKHSYKGVLGWLTPK